MYKAGIEVIDEDFEFAKFPFSKKSLRLVFEKNISLILSTISAKICSILQGKIRSLSCPCIRVQDTLEISNSYSFYGTRENPQAQV
jgi:hypothetical protein